MREIIGSTAGVVWKLLKENGDMKITQLPKALNEKPVIVYQALGWLARENKIVYTEIKNKILVSLADTE